MGNHVRNGRNYKDNIIKLSLNSFSTNSAIHENSSIYYDKNFNKSKNQIDCHQIKEKYYSKILHSEKMNEILKKEEIHSKNDIIGNAKINSRNNVNSLKNKIIILSSIKPSNSNNNFYNNKNISPKLELKTKYKNIIPFNSKNNIQNNNIHKIINNKKNTNVNKELSSDIFKKPNKENIKNKINTNQRKKLLNIKENDSLYNDKDKNTSSINSSKFINFDIINEKESIIDELEITNSSNKNNFFNFKKGKNLEKNNIQNKESFFEIEFEDYIKKLNLEEVNIDKELFERPLLYKRNKNFNLNNHQQNKLKNYLTTNNTSNNFFSNKIKIKNINDINCTSNFKKFSLRNSLNKNIKKATKNHEQPQKIIIEPKKQNNKIIKKNNNIQTFNINSFIKSRRILDLNHKKDILTSQNSYSNLLISNNFCNESYTNQNSSLSKEKKNSKLKGNFQKDYFNFKKLIIKKYLNINNCKNSDFLIASKEKSSNMNSQRNFQKSENISFKKIKSDKSSRKESPQIRSNKKIYKKGRNEIFDRYLKSNCHSTNLSKSKNIYMTRNSSENNLSSNIIHEQINKKNYKIIRIFKIKKCFKNNKNNSNKKVINKEKKFYLKKIKYSDNKYNYPIKRIKNNIFFSKRSSSSNNIFKDNNDSKNIEKELLI